MIPLWGSPICISNEFLEDDDVHRIRSNTSAVDWSPKQWGYSSSNRAEDAVILLLSCPRAAFLFERLTWWEWWGIWSAFECSTKLYFRFLICITTGTEDRLLLLRLRLLVVAWSILRPSIQSGQYHGIRFRSRRPSQRSSCGQLYINGNDKRGRRWRNMKFFDCRHSPYSFLFVDTGIINRWWPE